MKTLINIFLIGLFALSYSCSKEGAIGSAKPLSSLTIVNAISNSNPLVSDYSGLKQYLKNAQQIGYNSSFEAGIPSGSTPVVAYQITDSIHAVYNNVIQLQNEKIYSLFLCGNTATPDAVLTNDIPPYHAPADSTFGIRFINLSFGSNPISIDIQGKVNGSEIQNLAYKGITNFKSYPANYNISSYTFEFRDASSGSLLGTYTLSGINNGDDGDTNTNLYRWKNITIVLDGTPGSQNTFQVNNY